MSFHQTDYDYSTDGRFGTVNYKGVEQRYTRIDDDKWNDYRNQGDEGEDDYFAGGWEQKDMEDRRDEAAKKAKKEYERREKIRADIDRNASNIGKNTSAIDALNTKPEAEKKEEEPVVLSDKLSDAKERVKAYESNIRKPGEGSKYGVFGEEQTTTEPQPIKTETDPESPQQEAPSTKYELDVDEDKQSMADDYLAKYKVDLMDGKKFSV